MQEHRESGDDVLTDGPIRVEQLGQAITERLNRGVSLWKPGSVVTLRSGARYEVQSDGSWRKPQEE